MLRLVQKFHSKFRRKSAASPETSAALPPKPGANTERWSPSEARLLLECERSRRVLEAELYGSRAGHQTVVLGLDLTAGQLLLDNLVPAPPVHLLVDKQPFWLKLSLASGDYRICVLPREHLPGHQLLVDIITTQFAMRQPAVDALPVTFTAGPRVQLRLTSGKFIHGRLLQLSGDGGTVALEAVDASAFRQPQDRISCHLLFNQRFQPRCNARATGPVHSSRGRGGERHLVRLQFMHMTADDKQQLQGYLRACRNPSDRAA